MVAANSINESTTGICGFTGTAFTGTPVTQYNVIVGGSTSSTLTNVAPSATSGVPVVSQGAAADPVFGTAVVAGGGTGRVTLTNHGVLVGAGTTAITQLAAGSAGQVLQSGGASADPAYSTPTYPSASGSVGKILRSDGTNNLYTTATYPDTSGTSGNVLTSDGTNWTSATAPGAGILTTTITLTNAQVKALHGTPVQIIAAPGAGNMIRVISATGKLIYGGTNAFTAGGAASIAIVNSDLLALVCTVCANGLLILTTSSYDLPLLNSLVSRSVASTENLALMAYNPSATEIAGNAANNNTIAINVVYKILTM